MTIPYDALQTVDHIKEYCDIQLSRAISSIDEASIFFLAEHHGDGRCQRLEGRIMDILSKAEPFAIFREGKPSLLPCSEPRSFNWIVNYFRLSSTPPQMVEISGWDIDEEKYTNLRKQLLELFKANMAAASTLSHKYFPRRQEALISTLHGLEEWVTEHPQVETIFFPMGAKHLESHLFCPLAPFEELFHKLPAAIITPTKVFQSRLHPPYPFGEISSQEPL